MVEDASVFEVERIHVFPTWGPMHATDGQPCWCGPAFRAVEGGDVVMVVHNEPRS